MSKNNDIPLNSSVLEMILLILRDGSLHVRELSRLIGMSPTTTSAMLQGLEKSGILAKRISGNNYSYSLDRGQGSKKMAVMAYEYKAIKALCSDKKIEEASSEILRSMQGVRGVIDFILLSRSAVVIATSFDSNTIKDILSRISQMKGRRIIITAKENLRGALQEKDNKDILESGIAVYGVERFVETMHF